MAGMIPRFDPTRYETRLSPEKEEAFQVWKRRNAPNDSGEDYDLRGAYMSGLTSKAGEHGPDTFKKPNHPTFSTDSKYSTEETPGGTWGKAADGRDTYTPSEWMHKDKGRISLLPEYFKRVEPNVRLMAASVTGRVKPVAYTPPPQNKQSQDIRGTPAGYANRAKTVAARTLSQVVSTVALAERGANAAMNLLREDTDKISGVDLARGPSFTGGVRALDNYADRLDKEMDVRPWEATLDKASAMLTAIALGSKATGAPLPAWAQYKHGPVLGAKETLGSIAAQLIDDAAVQVGNSLGKKTEEYPTKLYSRKPL